VLQWLAAGVFLNSLAQVPLALVQGVGRPDLTAKLHLLELPLYVLGLWWLISTFGIVGAAIAWTLRVGLDAAVLFGMAQRFLGTTAEGRRLKVESGEESGPAAVAVTGESRLVTGGGAKNPRTRFRHSSPLDRFKTRSFKEDAAGTPVQRRSITW
jgi:hypothetical protein